jgi:outer membrane immunogenic protein
MKSLRVMCFVSLACVLIFGHTVLAEDKAPSFNWTGPYVGLHVGNGWGNADTSFSPRPNAVSFADLAPTSLSPDPSGPFGGIQAGYNYQSGCFVVGIEADFSWSGMSGSQTVSPIIRNDGTPFAGGGVLSASEEIKWFGTLRPRFGYTVTPSLLVYGTGGLAYGDVSYSANTDFRPLFATFYPASVSSTKVGWTVGGGFEYAVAKNWTIKTEYLYMDLGDQSAIANPSTPVSVPYKVGYNWETKAHLVSIGLNYKF